MAVAEEPTSQYLRDLRKRLERLPNMSPDVLDALDEAVAPVRESASWDQIRSQLGSPETAAPQSIEVAEDKGVDGMAEAETAVTRSMPDAYSEVIKGMAEKGRAYSQAQSGEVADANEIKTHADKVYADSQTNRRNNELRNGDSALSESDRLAERIRLGAEMESTLGDRFMDPKKYEKHLSKFSERAASLGVAPEKFDRFLGTKDLGPPSARESMEEAHKKEKAGFGGLAEWDKLQARRSADTPLGSDRGAKPIASFENRARRMSLSEKKRGNMGLSQHLAGIASKYDTEEAFLADLKKEGNPVLDYEIDNLADHRNRMREETANEDVGGRKKRKRDRDSGDVEIEEDEVEGVAPPKKKFFETED